MTFYICIQQIRFWWENWGGEPQQSTELNNNSYSTEKNGSRGYIFLPELSLKAKLRKGIYSKIVFQFHFYILGNNFIFQYYFTWIVKRIVWDCPPLCGRPCLCFARFLCGSVFWLPCLVFPGFLEGTICEFPNMCYHGLSC